LIVLTALVAAGTLAVAVIGSPAPDRFEQWLRTLGPLAPPLFVLAAAALTVLLCPKPILALAAGAAFGTVLGTALVVLGASLGAAGTYGIARRVGYEGMRRLAGGRLVVVEGWLAGRGFPAVLYARLVPIVPFSAVNYAGGVIGVRFRDFIAATLIGIIPGTFVPAALGASAQKLTPQVFLTALGLATALAIVGSVTHRLRSSGTPFVPQRRPPTRPPARDH
jgi:uncharacterized membrane protein YdjX (TVP38/TMEM64 family)